MTEKINPGLYNANHIPFANIDRVASQEVTKSRYLVFHEAMMGVVVLDRKTNYRYTKSELFGRHTKSALKKIVEFKHPDYIFLREIQHEQ